MAERVEQTRVIRPPEEQPGQDLALEQLRRPASLGESEQAAPLENANFRFAVEKDAVTEIERAAPAAEPQSEPRRPASRRASDKRGQRGAFTPARRRGTILDRLMDFVAEFLAKLDRAIFRRKPADKAQNSEADKLIEEQLIVDARRKMREQGEQPPLRERQGARRGDR